MSTLLRVGTFNIYNTTARYDIREGLLTTTINNLDLDILSLQEVEQNQVDKFWKPPHFFAPLQTPITADEDPTFQIDGNCILHHDLSFWSVVEDSQKIEHISKNRNCQLVEITNKAGNVYIANTHLHWATDPLGLSTREDAVIRNEQLRKVLLFITDSIPSDSNISILLCGDFNIYFSDETIYQSITDAGFSSCYREKHGHDVITVPTPLEAPTIHAEASVEQKADYIFLKTPPSCPYNISVDDCFLAANKPSPSDPTLYPSDHYALIANLSIKKK